MANPDLKDNYLKMLTDGYKPAEIEKFTKDMQTKDPSQVKAPTPKPGMKPMSAPMKGVGVEAGDGDAGGSTFHPGEKEMNPKQGSVSAALDFLAGKDKKKEKKEDLDQQGFPTPSKKKGSYSAAVSYLAGEDQDKE